MDKLQGYVKVDVAAQVLGVHKVTIVRWLHEGKFEYVAVGNRPFYYINVEKYLKEHKVCKK